MQHKDKKINIFGEFKDKSIERQYQIFEFGTIVKSVKTFIFYIALLYISCLIPEYLLLKEKNIFFYHILIRVIFVSLMLIFSFNIAKIQNYCIYCKIISIYEIILSLVIFLFLHYVKVNVFISITNYIIILILINFLPNKMKYTFVTNMLIFLYIYHRIINTPMKGNIKAAIIINIFLIMIVIVICCYFINKRKRKDFYLNRTIHDLSKKDPLTGLCNRSNFDNELQYYLSNQSIRPFGIIMFDIDNFKAINDTYGHLVGDSVLVEISTIIKDIVRKDDIYARWGGEEFIILTYNDNIESCYKLVKRIKSKMAEHNFKSVGKVTCSYGVTISNGYDDEKTIVERVDHLLYDAKKDGKNKIVCG